MKAEVGFHWRLFSTQLTCFLVPFFTYTLHVSGILNSQNHCSTKIDRLSPGSSLTSQQSTTCLVSPNETFSAGFYRVGDNAYVFAIWYTRIPDRTVAWVANGEQPVNGRESRLHLRKDGKLLLRDADGSVVWSTNTSNSNVKEAVLLETGNLVLRKSSGDDHQFLWESFQSPTDTLLPDQPLTHNAQLISRLGRGTFKEGYYRLYFDSDNVLRLIYQRSDIMGNYWPTPNEPNFENGRRTYNSSRLSVLDSFGSFLSSDGFSFEASDYGVGPKRRLTLDSDGNLRLYSLVEETGTWNIKWIAIPDQCSIHGLCGIYGLCIYTPTPNCTCPPGFHMRDSTDWFQGCRRNKELTGHSSSNIKLISLPHTDYYGYDIRNEDEMTFEECKRSCMNDIECEGFAYRMLGNGVCYPKYLLVSGLRAPNVWNHMYIKVSSNDSSVSNSTSVFQNLPLNCSALSPIVSETSQYRKHKTRSVVKYTLGFVIAFGVAELVCAILGWRYMLTAFRYPGLDTQSYSVIPGGFKKFSFSELKKATDNFKIKLGEGGFGTVYKGVLPDGEVVAVKQLEGVSQGDDQFWAEVSMIGRVHHMNLVRMFGFCAEGKHRLLVYEYVENGSLDKYLFTESPDSGIGNDKDRILGWKERFGIAVGTAKALGYLHEECLEWILHCDIKPQNILLDMNFCPKISDFGLAKLVDRDHSFSFSKIRGTRGYLAPEWAMNLPITAKVDVYSFGIVLLEIVTGRSSLSSSTVQNGGQLVQWVSAVMREGREIEEVVDPKLHGDFNSEEVERVLKTAMLCVEEEKDVRPSMSQAVEMLSQRNLFTPITDSILPNDSVHSFRSFYSIPYAAEGKPSCSLIAGEGEPSSSLKYKTEKRQGEIAKDKWQCKSEKRN